MKRWMNLLLVFVILFAIERGTTAVNAQQEIPELTILLDDMFDAEGLWAVTSGTNYSTRYVNGTYEMVNDLPGSYFSSVRPGILTNVMVEVVADFEQGAEGAAYGVACRWQNAHNFYATVIRSNGSVAILRIQNNTMTTLAERTLPFEASNLNQVGALCVGESLSLLLGREVVLQVRDSAFIDGAVGMVVMAGDEGSTVAHFNQFFLAAVNEALTETPVEFFPGIGPGEELYIVRHDETLEDIAQRFQISIGALMQRNPHILDPDLVFGGQRLAIPAGAATPQVDETALIPETGIQPQFIHPPDLHPNVAVPILHGEFDDADSWFTDAGEEVQVSYEDDVFRIINDSNQHYASSVRPFDLPLVHVEVNARPVGARQDGQWGLTCRWQNSNNFYAFLLDRDGIPSILKMQNGTATVLAEGEIAFEPTDWAEIGANCYGPLLTMYLNGAAVLQTLDAGFSDGYFGLITGPGLEVHFENLTAYIPASASMDLVE
jgi:LysM repeat protein